MKTSQSPSLSLSQAVKEMIKLVRPELSREQAEKASLIIAADVQPDATTVNQLDVRRTRKAVAKAIKSTN